MNLPTKEDCETVASILKSLSHPLRLQILCLLVTGPKTVGEIEDHCGSGQSQISQYLNRMKLEGFVSSTKSGQFVSYKIDNLQIKKLVGALHKIYC